MKIKTNNKPRPLHTDEEGQTYFMYKVETYYLEECVITDSIPGFEAAIGTSYFTAIAVKMVGTDNVIVAYVYW